MKRWAGGSPEESLLLQSYPSEALLPHLRDLLLTTAPVSTSILLSGTDWHHIVVETLPRPAEQHRFEFQQEIPRISIDDAESRPTFCDLALRLIEELELQYLVDNGPSPFELENAIKQATLCIPEDLCSMDEWLQKIMSF